MTTAFFSIANMSGIACASDSSHTIYKLANEQPLAVAVNPFSPIPWEEIIESYKRKGEPMHHQEFVDYVSDFSKHLETFVCKPEYKNLEEDDIRAIFLGYGVDDLYPCVCETFVDLSKETTLSLANVETCYISNDNKVIWQFIGNFENLATVFGGISNDFKRRLADILGTYYENYKRTVLEKVAGMEDGKRVEQIMNNQNIAEIIDKKISCDYQEKVVIGLDSFSMEELVYACENIVNASVRLNHLQSEGKYTSGSVREIAVVTRAEGTTWIKHCLFAI